MSAALQKKCDDSREINRFVLSAVALVVGLLAALFPLDSALANRRVALVIGNSAYQNVAVLANPASDARAMSEKFKQAGFDVVNAHFDLGNLQFKRALRQFEDAATDADVAVIFYAGHGIEIRGTNYMVPVDARLASDRDAEDEAITLDRLLQAVEGSKRLGLVILDACRDNPFLRNMKRTRMTAVRGATAGLSIVEPTGRNTLIAYAAKTGAFAEDGDGKNSPFTGALLSHLFVPGLDVRLAFGRIRDAVLKDTNQRQEPFVSGSLGGAHIALVVPPAKPAVTVAAVEADAAGQRNDYSLVEKIGTQRAWEIFLNQHSTGFYADLARQQLSKLGADEPAPGNSPARKTDGPTVAALEPPRPPASPRPAGEEQRAWDRIKDSSNTVAFRDFIKRYPSSVLANTAQTRLEAIERAAQEREEQARIEREAKAAEAQRAEEEKRAQAAAAAERQKAEREAAAKRAEEDRLVKQAEAERQKAEREAALRRAEVERLAKAAELAERQKAEREAALKRAEEERLVKQAEAERQKAEREAVAKRAEEARLAKLSEMERQKAEREAALKHAQEEQRAKAAEIAERQKAEREAAARHAEEERLVKQAEAERQKAETARQKAEQEAALKSAEAERIAKASTDAERQRLEREAALRRAEEERRAKAAAEVERQQALREAAAKRAEEDRVAKLAEATRVRQEAACKREENVISVSQTAANRGKAREDLERLEYDLTCERLRPNLLAALDKLTTMPDTKDATATLTPVAPDVIRAAQQELARIGCFAGPVDGNLSGATKDAVKRYQAQRGRQAAEINDDLVSDLKNRSARVCPLVCPAGKVAEGEQCIAARKPPAPVAKQKPDEDEKPARRQNVRQEREESRPQPRVRQEAAAPRNNSGGRNSGGGGGGGMSIGVGF